MNSWRVDYESGWFLSRVAENRRRFLLVLGKLGDFFGLEVSSCLEIIIGKVLKNLGVCAAIFVVIFAGGSSVPGLI